MPEKSLMNGTAVRITEFQIKEFDKFGDFHQIECLEDRKEAIKKANEWYKDLEDGIIGILVEKVVNYHPSHLFDKPTRYTEVVCLGNYPSDEEIDRLVEEDENKTS